MGRRLRQGTHVGSRQDLQVNAACGPGRWRRAAHSHSKCFVASATLLFFRAMSLQRTAVARHGNKEPDLTPLRPRKGRTSRLASLRPAQLLSAPANRSARALVQTPTPTRPGAVEVRCARFCLGNVTGLVWCRLEVLPTLNAHQRARSVTSNAASNSARGARAPNGQCGRILILALVFSRRPSSRDSQFHKPDPFLCTHTHHPGRRNVPTDRQLQPPGTSKLPHGN
mmetsp:Transcript_14808/g.23333  ORF Transcript_14808/g.23333 Transcript_14808/m.23333 type:complete len:226 (-) Transcript_14808:1637-2314(-)